jgi:hypothetical protein
MTTAPKALPATTAPTRNSARDTADIPATTSASPTGKSPSPLRLGDEARVPAAEGLIELSTDPGRGHGRADPPDLMLGPDEGIILRLG